MRERERRVRISVGREGEWAVSGASVTCVRRKAGSERGDIQQKYSDKSVAHKHAVRTK